MTKRARCMECPHREYLHDDRVIPTGNCQVEDCHEHAFTNGIAQPALFPEPAGRRL